MELVIIGSGTATPYGRRGPACVAVKLPREVLVFDLGAGALQKLAELRLDPFRLEHIFLTHFHVDHVTDLPLLLFAKRGPVRHNTDLTLHGPVGLDRFYTRLRELFGSWVEPPEEGYTLTVEELPEGGEPVAGPGWWVDYLPMRHRPESLGYRVQDERGRVIAYSGDTDECAEVVELGRDADILVLDCSHPDSRKVEGHLTPRLAGRIAREAGCRRLLLTHIQPIADRYDLKGEAAKEFGGEIYVAEDRMRIRI